VWVQPKDYKHVGAALAAARERAGLTQQQLARLLRKPQSSFLRKHPATIKHGLNGCAHGAGLLTPTTSTTSYSGFSPHLTTTRLSS
jgi:hypothetical protein